MKFGENNSTRCNFSQEVMIEMVSVVIGTLTILVGGTTALFSLSLCSAAKRADENIIKTQKNILPF